MSEISDKEAIERAVIKAMGWEPTEDGPGYHETKDAVLAEIEAAADARAREAVLNFKSRLRVAFRKALSGLPEIAPAEIASVLSSVHMQDEFWSEGRRLQLKYGLDAVAPRVEQECGAGAWSFMRQGVLSALSSRRGADDA